MEEGVTLTEPIVPWTVTGVYMASTLGVATLEYLPYSFFNLVSIVVMFIYILTFPKLKFAVPVLKEEEDKK